MNSLVFASTETCSLENTSVDSTPFESPISTLYPRLEHSTLFYDPLKNTDDRYPQIGNIPSKNDIKKSLGNGITPSIEEISRIVGNKASIKTCVLGSIGKDEIGAKIKQMFDNSGIYHRLEIINNKKTSCLYQLNSQNIWSYGASKHLSSSYIMKHSNLIRKCKVICIYVDMLVMDCLSISSLLRITANSLLVLNLQGIDYLEKEGYPMVKDFVGIVNYIIGDDLQYTCLLRCLYSTTSSFDEGLKRLSQKTNLFILKSSSVTHSQYAIHGNIYDVNMYAIDNRFYRDEKKVRNAIQAGILVGIYNGLSMVECCNLGNRYSMDSY